jgi:hypothetical protein
MKLTEGNTKFLRLKSGLQNDFVAAGFLFEALFPSRFLSSGGKAIA